MVSYKEMKHLRLSGFQTDSILYCPRNSSLKQIRNVHKTSGILQTRSLAGNPFCKICSFFTSLLHCRLKVRRQDDVCIIREMVVCLREMIEPDLMSFCSLSSID